MQNVSAWTYFLRNDRCVAQSKVVHRESTHTHTPYLESTHTHTRTIYFTESAQRMYISTHAPYLERARAHTRTPYILQKAHTHHIFYRRGDNAQHIPMRTYTPQSSIANTACKVRAPHLLQSLLRFLCSCAEAKCVQRSGHGLTSCAAIEDSRKVEYVHRQYRLQNTLHRNLRPLQRALTSANER
jgi:hypothetical protein